MSTLGDRNNNKTHGKNVKTTSAMVVLFSRIPHCVTIENLKYRIELEDGMRMSHYSLPLNTQRSMKSRLGTNYAETHTYTPQAAKCKDIVDFFCMHVGKSLAYKTNSKRASQPQPKRRNSSPANKDTRCSPWAMLKTGSLVM